MKKLLLLLVFIPLVSFGQNLPTDFSEKSVRNFFYKKGFKGIEGIYTYKHADTDGSAKSRYKLAFIYSKQEFKYLGYVMETNKEWTGFNVGEIKLALQPTSSNTVFDGKWFLKQVVLEREYGKNFRYVPGVSKAKYPGTLYASRLWFTKADGTILQSEDIGNNSKQILLKLFPNREDLSRAQKPKKIKNKSWVGNGSGLIISKQGHIVTNHHVIKDIDSIEVEFKNDLGINKFKAKVINSDKSNDLAIIQIVDKKFEGFEETPNYNFDTEIAEVGTKVYAYGYPMALSIMGKEIKITDGIINSKMGFKDDIKTYQISAPIQGGNSGGPLFDEDGTLVGINSSGLSKEIADNVGYSIKSNYISNLISALPQIIELPYSYTIKWISTEKQIKRLSQYVVLIKVK